MAPALSKYLKAYNTSSKGLGLAGKVPIVIAHGKKDSVIDINDCRALANASNGKIKLYEVDEDYNLRKIIQGEELKNIILEAVEMNERASSV
jgi:predicted esterase